MHNCSHSRQQINLFIHVAVILLHIWSWKMWSQTIKIIIMDTDQLGGHLKNGSEVTSAHLFIFIGVLVRVTNLIYFPLLLRVQDPDIQIWSGTLLRISNALLIHPLSYWHLGGNPSFLFLSFLALQPLVYLRVCVWQHLFPLIVCSEREERCGEGWECNGNHFFVTAPRVWSGCCRGLLDWSYNAHTHTHTQTQALKKICYMDCIYTPSACPPSMPPFD